MSLKNVFRYYGDQADIARILKVSPTVIGKWFKRGHLPINQALILEQAFGFPAEDMVEPKLGILLANRPRKKTMKITDPRAGVRIDGNDAHATWVYSAPVAALPDTFEVTLSSQSLVAKDPNALQIRAQVFLSRQGIENLSRAISPSIDK